MGTAPLFIKALRGERGARPPIWLMRQAGRYLPEYRAIRAKYSMLETIRSAELAAKVTLQPIERFGFDAAIIFADILNPLIGMGVTLDFIEGEGPKIFNPVRTAADVEKLTNPDPKENVGYTLDAIRQVAEALSPKGVPLIGFSGAPFTLSTYLIHREDSGDQKSVVRFMREEERAWDALQQKLVKLVSDYLVAQVDAGASAVQIFDSWVGILSPSEFSRSALPYLKEIVKNIKSRTSVPVIYFATSSSGLFELLPEIGADAYGVDWRVSLPYADRALGAGKFPLQGNLDPTLLVGKWECVEREAKRILEEGRGLRSHIFNLGHGILPETPIENVERLVRLVKGA